jgi:hypothetical protein
MSRKGKKPSRAEAYHLQVVIEMDEDDKMWHGALH